MSRIATTHKLTERKARRKQNALLPQHDGKLPTLAQQQRLTEVDLIRQAVEVFPSQLPVTDGKLAPAKTASWQGLLATFEESRKTSLANKRARQ